MAVVKIRVDYDLCEGNGVCAQLAPAVFRVDDDDQLHVLRDRPGEELRAEVELAVRRCPRGALAVDDAD
jgi:ferredoxin